MKALRWLAFLPVWVVVLSLGQLAANFLALKLNGFVLALVLLFAGIFWVVAGMIPVLICPSRKVGGIILALLFVALEVASLTINTPTMTDMEWTARIWTDFTMLLGMLGAALQNEETKAA